MGECSEFINYPPLFLKLFFLVLCIIFTVLVNCDSTLAASVHIVLCMTKNDIKCMNKISQIKNYSLEQSRCLFLSFLQLYIHKQVVQHYSVYPENTWHIAHLFSSSDSLWRWRSLVLTEKICI